MTYYVNAPGFEGGRLIAQSGGAFSGFKLFQDGYPAPRGPQRGQYLLTRNDGRTVVASFRGGFPDPVPKVVVDGVSHALVEPLAWYQILWACLPFAMVAFGGAIGGGLGGAAAAANAHVFRTNLMEPMKYVVTLGISAAAVVAWLLIALSLAPRT